MFEQYIQIYTAMVDSSCLIAHSWLINNCIYVFQELRLLQQIWENSRELLERRENLSKLNNNHDQSHHLINYSSTDQSHHLINYSSTDQSHHTSFGLKTSIFDQNIFKLRFSWSNLIIHYTTQSVDFELTLDQVIHKKTRFILFKIN